MQYQIVVFVCCALSVIACQPAAPPEPGIEQALQQIVDSSVVGNDSVHGVALHVDSVALGLNWEGGAGEADPATAEPMTPLHPVRIASNTKTYVAAAVLRLWEQGRLGLDDPISQHLPVEFVEILRGDGYDTEAMTARHLLTHTSGLFDHSGPEEYGERIVANPTYHWTRAEKLGLAAEWGDPHAGPGEIYTYCDTGYILLGLVVEQVTGQPLAVAVRELVDYDTLGLTATWWEIFEPAPDGVRDRAHQFLGEIDVYDFEPYFDLYGGGGLAATVGDMARFTRALFEGEVYENPETLDTMLTTYEGLRPLPDASARALPSGAYRMGIWEVEVAGFTTWRHSGFWGTVATYVPELDLVVAATVNQNQSGTVMDDVVKEAIEVVANASKP